MDAQALINQLLGNWITQNTVYCVRKKYINISKNAVSWLTVQNTYNFFTNIANKISKKYTEMYLIEISHRYASNTKYCLFLFDSTQSKGIILVLSYNFHFLYLNTFKHDSSNLIYIKSKDTYVKTKEKIYFVNNNLKLTKSTIEKNQVFIGVSFGSEIRVE